MSPPGSASALKRGTRSSVQCCGNTIRFLTAKSGVVGCPVLNTRALQALGLRLDGSYQELDGAAVYPSDRFNPYNDATGRLYLTENTYTIHWYSKSWMSRTAVLRSKLTRPLHRLGLGHGVRSGCRNGGV